MENAPDKNIEKPLDKKTENKSTTQTINENIVVKQNFAITKFASVLLIFSFIGVLFSLFSVLSFLIVALYYIILLAILLLTLFILLPKLKPWFDKGQEVQTFIASTYSLLPYVLGASTILATAALLIFIFKKNYINRTSRIIFASIMLFINLAIIIVKFLILKNN